MQRLVGRAGNPQGGPVTVPVLPLPELSLVLPSKVSTPPDSWPRMDRRDILRGLRVEPDIIDVQRAVRPEPSMPIVRERTLSDVPGGGQIDVPFLPGGPGQVCRVAVIGHFHVVDLDVQLAAVAGCACEVDRTGS